MESGLTLFNKASISLPSWSALVERVGQHLTNLRDVKSSSDVWEGGGGAPDWVRRAEALFFQEVQEAGH